MIKTIPDRYNDMHHVRNEYWTCKFLLSMQETQLNRPGAIAEPKKKTLQHTVMQQFIEYDQ